MTDQGSRQSNDSNASFPDWEAIARFLSGESPADEAATVEAWLATHPADRELVERLGQAAMLPVADVDVESALQLVHARMREEPAAPRLVVERGTASRWQRKHTAAITLLAAAVAFAAIVLRPSAPSGDHPAVTAVARTYATAVGQRDSITLPDSSLVILGPDSRLIVASNYGNTTRAVELRGDGYFDVRHDAAKPFSVRVDRAIVEDIGTTFAIESDAGDTTAVAVITGSVRLRASDSSPSAGAVLSAGDRGSMSPDGQVRAYPHSVTDEAAWTTGRLVFRDASLVRVAGEIRRWYGVNLVIGDSAFANRHVTATFNGEPVDQVLKIIGLTLGARIERQGDSATVISNRGSATAR